MKIVYIVNTLMPTDKAHGYQISKVCEKLSEIGNDIKLLVPNRKNHVGDDLFEYYGIKRNFEFERIPCLDVIFLGHYIGALAFYIQTLFFSIRLFIKKIDKGSLIYSRDIIPVWIFKLRGFSVVYNAHNWSKKRKWFLRIFLGKDLKVVCNSEGTRRQVIKSGFSNSVAIPNGVELREFENLGNKVDIRKNFNLPLDKKIIMYVGHLYGWKGVEIILLTAKLLRNRDDIIFIIIGGDKIERREYEVKIVKEGIENVLFLGHKLKKEIPKYLTSADILLLPNTSVTNESVKFTSPIKMFEYMASGVPIITSDMPSIREVLNDDTALFVKAGDYQALSLGIEKILSDNVFGERVAHNARESVKKYTWDEHVRKLIIFLS